MIVLYWMSSGQKKDLDQVTTAKLPKSFGHNEAASSSSRDHRPRTFTSMSECNDVFGRRVVSTGDITLIRTRNMQQQYVVAYRCDKRYTSGGG